MRYSNGPSQYTPAPLFGSVEAEVIQDAISRTQKHLCAVTFQELRTAALLTTAPLSLCPIPQRSSEVLGLQGISLQSLEKQRLRHHHEGMCRLTSPPHSPHSTVSNVAISHGINAIINRLDEPPGRTLSNCTFTVAAVAGIDPKF